MEIVSAVLSYEGVSMKLNASKQTVAGLVSLLRNAQIIQFFQMAKSDL